MKLTRLISLPYKEAHRIRERQKSGTMTEFYDDEQYLCFSEEELKNYKPKKRGRPSGTKNKRTKRRRVGRPSKPKGEWEMVINYKFDESFFDYEIEYTQYQKALIHLLLQESKESLVEKLVSADGCVIDLETDYGEELKAHFEESAYKEYLNRRYA